MIVRDILYRSNRELFDKLKGVYLTLKDGRNISIVSIDDSTSMVNFDITQDVDPKDGVTKISVEFLDSEFDDATASFLALMGVK